MLGIFHALLFVLSLKYTVATALETHSGDLLSSQGQFVLPLLLCGGSDWWRVDYPECTVIPQGPCCFIVQRVKFPALNLVSRAWNPLGKTRAQLRTENPETNRIAQDL